jgi:hypothetical protein
MLYCMNQQKRGSFAIAPHVDVHMAGRLALSRTSNRHWNTFASRTRRSAAPPLPRSLDGGCGGGSVSRPGGRQCRARDRLQGARPGATSQRSCARRAKVRGDRPRHELLALCGGTHHRVDQIGPTQEMPRDQPDPFKRDATVAAPYRSCRRRRMLRGCRSGLSPSSRGELLPSHRKFPYPCATDPAITGPRTSLEGERKTHVQRNLPYP